MNQLKHEWCELDLFSKSGLIISVLLLVELIFTIFFEPMTHRASITATFSTSLSSILGYIIGMNIPHPTKDQTNSQIDKSMETEENETLQYLRLNFSYKKSHLT